MKKLILALALLVAMDAGAQALSKYERHGKLTTTEISEIDTTRTDIAYTAYDITKGFEVINRMDGEGWVPRIVAAPALAAFSTLTGEPDDNTALGDALEGKQDTLSSGINIKTINSQSILGSGNITIEGGGGSFATITGDPEDNTALAEELESKVAVGEGSPINTITAVAGPVEDLDELPPVAEGTVRLEIETDGEGDIVSDYYAESLSVTGTGTKTITLGRSGGLSPLTANFTDLSGGTADGNDFLTSVTRSGDVFTFNVPGQTSPTYNFGSYLATKGYLTSEVDGSTTNEIQTISKSGSMVTLSNGGGNFIDADTQLTEEQVEDYVGGMVTGNTETGITVTYQDADGTLDFVAADTSPTNEIQVLSLATNTLSLSAGGGSVTLPVSDVVQTVGAFVPTVVGTMGGSYTITPTGGGDLGRYIRIGRFVYFSMRATVTGITGTIAGDLRVDLNIPGATQMSTTYGTVNIHRFAVAPGQQSFSTITGLSSNGSVVFTYTDGPGQTTGIGYPAPTATGTQIIISGTYITN